MNNVTTSNKQRVESQHSAFINYLNYIIKTICVNFHFILAYDSLYGIRCNCCYGIGNRHVVELESEFES